MRRVTWGHGVTVVGTALAAVAAIGGLWAQAVASYWTQQTAKDQLSQSKDESARQERDQASKVSYWGGGGSAFEWGGTGSLSSKGAGTGALHVFNRSPDPIPHADIAIQITRKDSSDTDELIGETWVITLSNIPPCTHLEYPESKLQLGFITDGNPQAVSSGAGIWVPVSMYFVDTRGKEWRRTQTSLKEGTVQKNIADALEERANIVGTDVKIRRTESCGDAGG